MDLLIHDLAAACERDAADDYDVYDRTYRTDMRHREPFLRFRSGRVDLVHPQPVDEPDTVD
jgi:hypothetical protein